MWNPGTTNCEPVEMEKEVSLMFYLTTVERLIDRTKKYHIKGNILMFRKKQSP